MNGSRAARLLFVCTGNTCRSPLAAALTRREAGRRDLAFVEVRSAGTFAGSGAPASQGSLIVAQRHGVDLSEHRSSPLGPEQVEWADLVLGMEKSHVGVAEREGAGDRASLVTAYLAPDHPAHGRPISDPVGGGMEQYEEVYRLLEEAVAALFRELYGPPPRADGEDGDGSGGGEAGGPG